MTEEKLNCDNTVAMLTVQNLQKSTVKHSSVYADSWEWGSE